MGRGGHGDGGDEFEADSGRRHGSRWRESVAPARPAAGTALTLASCTISTCLFNAAAAPKTLKNERAFHRARPIGQCGRRRRCLHGLCHGSQWPWLTSPVLSASPAVARARRALNHLHLLVSSGSANNSVCVFVFARTPLGLAVGTATQHTPDRRYSLPDTAGVRHGEAASFLRAVSF